MKLAVVQADIILGKAGARLDGDMIFAGHCSIFAGANKSDRAMGTTRDFVEFWVTNCIHAAEQYGTAGASQRTSELTARFVDMAAAQGISKAELEAEVGNLPAFIKSALEQANIDENERRDRHRI